jgi:hypothetical protein
MLGGGEYPLIRRYGRYLHRGGKLTYLGSLALIAGQIARARAEGVAQDAVYWFDGRWFYAADIRSEDTRAALKLPLEQEVMSDE